MHESLSSMAQLTLNASFDATNIMEFRKVVKAKKEKYGLKQYNDKRHDTNMPYRG